MTKSKKQPVSIKRVIFLGRKAEAVEAAKFLQDQGIKISLMVAPIKEDYSPSLKKFAYLNKIPLIHDDKILYRRIKKNDQKTKNIDLVISYLYWKKIKLPLIKIASRGCINFHPAPLPDYKSRAGYNTAILEGKKYFGVSAHFINSEKLDSGPIIKVLKFPIRPQENVIDLINKTQKKLLILFKQVIKIFMSREKISTTENKGGLFLTIDQLENLKQIDSKKDSLKTIHKKIKAFFFPPHHGAIIKIKGEKFTLIDEEMLQYLADIIKRNNN